MNDSRPEPELTDFEPTTGDFLADVIAGLGSSPKSLPSKYFYDARGSELFEEICELDEYYLTRTELAIMEESIDEITAAIGKRAMLVEYGSGSSTKTRWLLDHLDDPVAYVPVDISASHLKRVAQDLARAYPQIEILPVCADFTDRFELPTPRREPSRDVVYFPGSTMGNFPPPEAHRFLAGVVEVAGAGGGLLIGLDLQKDTETIEAAYNDARGVTAEFNRNILARIQRELDGELDLAGFEHESKYRPENERVETSLLSLRDQTIRVSGHTFEVAAGERIRTEYSYKYTIDGFAELAREHGLELERHWKDPRNLFAVVYLSVRS